jgi:Flp pilus assembly protein TadG
MALLLPVFVMVLLGVINTSLMAGALSGMHYAVEEGSRCFAVNKTRCGSITAARTFAASQYTGLAPTPTFSVTTDGCGHTVTATATFRLDLALTKIDIPLSATACYPGVET